MMPESRSQRPRFAPVAALAASLALASLAGCGGEKPPDTSPARTVLSPEPDVIRLAGSGALLPLVRLYGAACPCSASPSSPRIVVEDSIGSGGGLRAAAEGAVDVGLISRPLTKVESQLRLVEVPIALDAVLIAAHPDVQVLGVTTHELVALYGGDRFTFADGSPASVLLRDRGESANLALATLPGMAGIAAAADRTDPLSRRRAFPIIYHDDAMIAALALTPHALGVSSLGLLDASRLPLTVLALDGRRPSVETIADRSWPLIRRLSLVMRPERAARVRPLIDFIFSEEGRRLAREHGYLPLAPPPSLAQ